MALYRHKNSKIWTMDFHVNSMRIRESTGMTSRTRAQEVYEKRKQGLKEGIAGIKKKKQPVLLSIASEDYLAKKTNKWTPNTLRIEKTNLGHLLPELGRKLVCDIEAMDVARYQQKRINEGASAKTINLETGTLRAILKRGGQWARLQGDDDKVDMLATQDDIGRAITPEEESALLKACTESRSRSLLTFVTLAIDTGARYDTIRTLKWGYVDFERRCLKWGKDKTEAGTGRVIPLNQRAIATLSFWATQFPDRKPKHYVFPTENYGATGQRFKETPKAYNTDPDEPTGSNKEAWEGAKGRAGIEVRFHDLRHTAVSRMLNAGVPITKVAKIVGWSTSTMVKMAKKYGHFSLDDLRGAVESISSCPPNEIVPETPGQKWVESVIYTAIQRDLMAELRRAIEGMGSREIATQSDTTQTVQ
jgi:integrase